MSWIHNTLQHPIHHPKQLQKDLNTFKVLRKTINYQQKWFHTPGVSHTKQVSETKDLCLVPF